MKKINELQLTVTKEDFEKIKDFKVIKNADVIDKSFNNKRIIAWGNIKKRDKNKLLNRLNKKDLSFIIAQVRKSENSYFENTLNAFIRTREDYNMIY